jgi:hypothetical protein
MLEGEDRIETFVLDERYPQDIKGVMRKVGKDIDIFIDDGAHEHDIQILLAKTVLPILKKDVIYIIEDVFSPKRVVKALNELGYECEVPKLEKEAYREHLVIVKNK